MLTQTAGKLEPVLREEQEAVSLKAAHRCHSYVLVSIPPDYQPHIQSIQQVSVVIQPLHLPRL